MSDPIEKTLLAWYTKTTDETMRELATSSSGLSAHEAGQRLEQSGPNMLKEGARRSPLMMIVDQFKDFLIIILLIAAVIAGVVGDPVEAYAILAIVVLNAVIGFFQEFRAEKAMAALRSMAAPSAAVLRDGSPQNIAACRYRARRCGAAGGRKNRACRYAPA